MKFIVNSLLKSFTLAALILLSTTGFSQAPLSPRIANYDIAVKLDVAEKKLIGKETLYWTNTSEDTIEEMPFHLYFNAFKNSETSLLRDWYKLPDFFAQPLEYGGEWGWVEIGQILDENGNDLSNTIRYLNPDDDNENDETVMSIKLAQPLLPGEKIELEIDWLTRIPRCQIRSGYNDEFYFLGQWYPKIGVYEPAGSRYAETGQWNCHQYHFKGEFYADFGRYNVDITVPKNFVVGATGEMVNEEEGEETKTYSFNASDVIDFTWTASPNFVLQKDQWKEVNLTYLSYADHSYMADRYFKTIKYCLEFFETKFEKYPYPNLTLVEPPFSGLFAMAMEYPTLLTVGSFGFLPEGIRSAEVLAAHEFIHQYFMQMIASNETEEPWMDEGITTYYEGRLMDEYHNDKSYSLDWLGIHVNNKDITRNTYVNQSNPKIAENSRASWEYENGGYEVISYNKAGVWLWTLEGLVGVETIDEIMATYFQRWKFKHPCGTDFIAVVNEVVQKNHGDKFGEDMNWFFDQVIHTTSACDYKVSYVGNAGEKAPMGIEVGGNTLMEKTNGEAVYFSKVVVERLEEMTLPVEVLVTFFDGTTVLENWDGKARSQTFKYRGKYGVKSAQLDPEGKIYLDRNYLNNSFTYQPETTVVKKYASKFMFWMQNVMQSALFLV